MREVSIHHPITIPTLAEALDLKPYRLLAELIKIAVFPAPRAVVDDLIAIDLAASMGVNLRIIGDEDDGSTRSPSPTNPPSPLGGFKSIKS